MFFAAMPAIVFFQKEHVRASALGTDNTIGPAPSYHVFTAINRIREENDCVLKCRRFHTEILAGTVYFVKYIITLLSKLLALTHPGIELLLKTKGEVKFDRTVTERSKLSFGLVFTPNLVAFSVHSKCDRFTRMPLILNYQRPSQYVPQDEFISYRILFARVHPVDSGGSFAGFRNELCLHAR